MNFSPFMGKLVFGGARDPQGPEPRVRNSTPLSAAMAMLVLGFVFGLGAASVQSSHFVAGLVIFAVLAVLIGIARRLAERSDQRLIAGDASYHAFFQHALEGIFRTTPDGHYLDANPALARIYGYESPRQLMTALTDIGVMLYVDPLRRIEFQSEMLAHDQVTDFVSQIRRRDGTLIWIAENARAVRDWTGRIVCYEGTVEDVTAHFETEQAVREALRQSEEANRAKSSFLAAMSHELKTPLNAVIGFSEMLKEEILGPLGQPNYKAYAGDIHTSGKRLLGIINDVLDVSRMQGGTITLNKRAASLRDIVEDAIAKAKDIAGGERDVAIELGTPIIMANSDPDRLRQVLTNLISNALKFTPEGGEIIVRCWDEGTDISLQVCDNGIGMASETVAAALEPFHQLDGALSRRFEGTGLGLTIAKGLIELHGGKLTIQSEVGHGTVASVSLPGAHIVPEPLRIAS
jgi:PAS domain S-box-containing protein